jgi:hypothetical protein
MKKSFAIISLIFSLSAVCMNDYKVAVLDTGATFGLACNATFANFSQGHMLYYPVLEAQKCLFDKIVEKARSISINSSEYTDDSEEKLVSGNLQSLGVLVYAIYGRDKSFALPEFISQALASEYIVSSDELPEGGVLISTDGSVFCNRKQFEWTKKQTQ